MCICGHHPKDFLSTSSLSQLTTHELMELLKKMGHKSCDISDDATGIVGIRTDRELTFYEKQIIESAMPPGVVLRFWVNSGDQVSVPASLEKWVKSTAKEIKKIEDKKAKEGEEP
jgi:hypothetical protein